MDEQYRRELEAIVAANHAAVARGDVGYWRKTRARKSTTKRAADPITAMLREAEQSYKPGALKAHSDRDVKA